MGIIKIYFFFYFSLHLLLIVCGDVESNPGPGSDKRVGSSIPTFVVFMPIWTSWPWLDRMMMFWFVLSIKVSDRRYLSELRIPGFGCPQQRLRNSTPGAQGMLLPAEQVGVFLT